MSSGREVERVHMRLHCQMHCIHMVAQKQDGCLGLCSPRNKMTSVHVGSRCRDGAHFVPSLRLKRQTNRGGRCFGFSKTNRYWNRYPKRTDIGNEPISKTNRYPKRNDIGVNRICFFFTAEARLVPRTTECM